MKLSKHTLSGLAEMICGGLNNFLYRSSSYLAEFFTHCGMEYVHDGSTRKWWVLGVPQELNIGLASSPALPPDTLSRSRAAYFDRDNMDRNVALAHLNSIIGRDGLQAFFDNTGRCRPF